ncbi:MAG: diaminopimelate decarboxylase [Gemmatimonadetes bacterium]|jgi:diaminopimelate decarboxylase|nr:diaminopimelate decarboxylase [Gemmatimonadota bacterium]MBT7861757.1 diaminopimelate decarboxylase [Gemmatimonadota bacterium]
MAISTDPYRFLTDPDALDLLREHGSPLYVYDETMLRQQAQRALAFPNPFGLTVRYAMKACPNGAILRILAGEGLHVDASSGWEARRAMAAGVAPNRIMLTAQQLADDVAQLFEKGVRFNACSLHQLASFGRLFPGASVGVRVNPGLGSGHSNRTNVGGPSASFGIWHEHLPQILQIADEHDLDIQLLHSHIGSGSDPDVWQRCAHMTLQIAERLESVTTISLGGGFKVARMAEETPTNLSLAGGPIQQELRAFAERHGRELHLEIEPGTYLAANVGALLTTIVDVVDTGDEGYQFLKIDSGMTEILRPSMYGSQHPITLISQHDGADIRMQEYLVVGHCCESGDVLTPAPDNPEGLLTRSLQSARIGDGLLIGSSGAYCAAMSAKNYNSFPEAAEILRRTTGEFALIRQRQAPESVYANEIMPDNLS